MALLDVSSAARYGMNVSYADKLFASSSSSSSYQFGEVSVDYTDGCASRNTWGQCRSGTRQRNRAAVYNDASRLQFANLSVSGNQWKANKASSNGQLHRMLQDANRDAPVTIFDPVVNKSAGDRYNNNTRSGVKTYIDLPGTTYKPGRIRFTSNLGEAQLGTGTVTRSVMDLSQGGGASQQFTFIPGNVQTFTLSRSVADENIVTTTTGSRNSSSNTQEAFLTISNSTTVDATVKGSGSVSVTAGISGGYRGAWTSTSEHNFSDSSEQRTSSTRRFEVSVPIGSAILVDGSTDYELQVINPNTGLPDSFKFQVGRRYEVFLSYLNSQVQNTITGRYSISGDAGLIQDSFKNISNPTAARAIQLADQRQGGSVLGYSFDAGEGLGALSPAGDSISFTGSATAGTRLSTDFSLSYAEVATPSAALMADPDSLALRADANARVDTSMAMYSMAIADSTPNDGVGITMRMNTQQGETALLLGTGDQDIIFAAEVGQHEYREFKNSILKGNHDVDRFYFKDNDTGNTIYAYKADDYVASAASNTSAGLGKGNDTYVINGGTNHQIALGMGNDRVEINAVDNVSFSIQDFDITEDSLWISDDLDSTLFDVELVQADEGLAWSSYLSFQYNDNEIGTANLLDNRSQALDKMMNIDHMLEFAFLNADRLDYNQVLEKVGNREVNTAHEMLQIVALDSNVFISNDQVNHNDWKSMSANDRAELIAVALEDVGSQMSVDDLMQMSEGMDISVADEFSMDLIEKVFGTANVLDNVSL